MSAITARSKSHGRPAGAKVTPQHSAIQRDSGASLTSLERSLPTRGRNRRLSSNIAARLCRNVEPPMFPPT